MNKKILIVIFGLILVTPTVVMMLGTGKGFKLEENRELAPRPIAWTKEYPKLFTNFFSDNFGGRNYLIVADRWMRYKLFNVSPNKAITIGKSNWLFYTPDVNYIDSVNGQAFSQTDLEQIKTNLTEIQDNFGKMGIKFYFLAAPNKQSIYPEFLPDYMKKVRPDSRLDQISEYLKDDKKINFINPKNELLEAKKNGEVYLKYDTHWNEEGAWVGYKVLMEKMGLKARSKDDFAVTVKTAPNRDLALQMGVEGDFSEKEVMLENKNKISKIVKEDCPKMYTGCPLTVRETRNKKLPKLVMYRDSFGVGLIPFLAEDFQRSYFIWGATPLSTEVVNKEKPDYVVMELTERELWRLKEKVFEW